MPKLNTETIRRKEMGREEQGGKGRGEKRWVLYCTSRSMRLRDDDHKFKAIL